MFYTKELLKALHDNQINVIDICGIVSGGKGSNYEEILGQKKSSL